MVNAKLPFVIGAGLGRTGTYSLRMALIELGYKTFHMSEIFNEVSPIEPWTDYATSRRNKDDNAPELRTTLINHVLEEGYNATTDLPACLFFKDLLEVHPDGKVILSIRTSPELWAKSVMNTIGKVHTAIYDKYPFKLSPFFSKFAMLNSWLWEEIGEAPLGESDASKPKDRDTLIKIYDEWNDHVIANVPKKQLLIHKSADGFGPICKHLGIPSDECPKEYPYTNDTEEFGKIVFVLACSRAGFWLVILIFMIYSVWYVNRMLLGQMTQKVDKQD